MKRLMKKKVNVFGKSVPVFAIVLLSVALVSGALVPYLSNVITGMVTVKSPLEMNIGGDGTNWQTNPLNLGIVHGGENVTFYVQVNNNAKVDIDEGLTIEITTDKTGATCEDFSSLTAKVTENTHNPDQIGSTTNLLAPCNNVSGQVKIILPMMYYSGETEEYKIDGTFKLNVEPANYTMTAQATLAE